MEIAEKLKEEGKPIVFSTVSRMLQKSNSGDLQQDTNVPRIKAELLDWKKKVCFLELH